MNLLKNMAVYLVIINDKDAKTVRHCPATYEFDTAILPKEEKGNKKNDVHLNKAIHDYFPFDML